MWHLEFSKTAIKDLKKLSPNVQKTIIKKLEFFISLDNPLTHANYLINYDIGQYRFRIDDYRVVFDLYDEKIVVLTLGHRKQIYR
jgi:mRNA interferase RelE/StbE